MRRVLLVVLGSLLAVASAEARGELSGENLLIEIPQGYVLGYNQKTDQGEINEFIPEGETAEEWSEMITVQLLPAHNSNAKFYAAFEPLAREACKGGSTHVVATVKENEYPVNVFQLACPTNLQTDMGEVTFIKTIEGKDKFYVVQKAWRTDKYDEGVLPLTREDVVKWTQYLRSVHVCDSRIDKRECP